MELAVAAFYRQYRGCLGPGGGAGASAQLASVLAAVGGEGELHVPCTPASGKQAEQVLCRLSEQSGLEGA